MPGVPSLNEETVVSHEGILVHLQIHRHLLTKGIMFRLFLLCLVDDSRI